MADTDVMTDLDKLKKRIADFIQRTGMSKRDVGERSCNDCSFVKDLDEGREPRFSTIKKVHAWIDLYEIDPDAALGRSPRRPDVAA